MIKLCECGCRQPTKIIKNTDKRYGRVKGEYNRFINGHQSIDRMRSKEARIKMSNAWIGKNNPNYNNGISCRRTYCKDCGKPLSDYRAVRCSSCCRLKDKNWGWKGGVTPEPYPITFNNQLKDKIRARDNFICQLCGIPELECYARLTCHHIDYDKENCREDNLTSLCYGCNSRVNFNREYWTNYFQCLIGKR